MCSTRVSWQWSDIFGKVAKNYNEEYTISKTFTPILFWLMPQCHFMVCFKAIILCATKYSKCLQNSHEALLKTNDSIERTGELNLWHTVCVRISNNSDSGRAKAFMWVSRTEVCRVSTTSIVCFLRQVAQLLLQVFYLCHPLRCTWWRTACFISIVDVICKNIYMIFAPCPISIFDTTQESLSFVFLCIFSVFKRVVFLDNSRFLHR